MNRFDKRYCKECQRYTWHFKTSDLVGFECPCQTPLGILKNPKKPIVYSISHDVVNTTAQVKPVKKPEIMRRKWIPKPVGPKPLTSDKCVGCGVSVIPGQVRVGSVLGNLQHFSLKGVEIVPIEGEIECLGHTRRFVYRKDEVETIKKVAFRKREKGFLCAKCCSNYKSVKDYNGVNHPLVKVEPLAGFFEEGRKDIKHFQHETSIYDPPSSTFNSHKPVLDVRAFRAFRHL